MNYLPAATPADFARIASRGRWRLTPHLALLDRCLVALAARQINRLIVTMPPRHGKSLLISRYFPAWWVGTFPEEHAYLTSYGDDLASQWSIRARESLENFGPSVFGVRPASRGGSNWFVRHHEGSCRAAGTRGVMTGLGANLLVIDDPHKNAEEASSPTMRQKVWDWFESTAYTRLEPNAVVVIVMCMVGGTRILMSDGSEKFLRDIRPGDTVASYRDGRLVSMRVLNWKNQGPDAVYTIRTASGITVTANAKHPFLVDRNGRREWVSLRDLKTGDLMVRVTGENGAESTAPVENQPAARDSVCLATTESDGPMGIDRRPITLDLGVTRDCAIATESASMSTKRCSSSKEEGAQYVESYQGKILVRTGEENSASTMTTRRGASEGCSATTVISPSAMESPSEFCSPLLNTCTITLDRVDAIEPAGCEDVFDIQVETTENFIANGLVSHNTRWHEDDLVGRLLQNPVEGETWHLLNLPALAEIDEPPFPRGLGRSRGDALWPDRFPISRLSQIQARLSSRWFSALYQQRPTPEGGDIFKEQWFPLSTQHATLIRQVRYWDLAATFGTQGDPDYTAGCRMAYGADGRYYIMDVRRNRLSPGSIFDYILSTALVDGSAVPIYIEQEGGAGSKIAIHEILRHFHRQGHPEYSIKANPERISKELRAEPLAAAAEHGFIRCIRGPWDYRSFVHELTLFPSGAHDDMVDAASGAYNRIANRSGKVATSGSYSASILNYSPGGPQ